MFQQQQCVPPFVNQLANIHQLGHTNPLLERTLSNYCPIVNVERGMGWNPMMNFVPPVFNSCCQFHPFGGCNPTCGFTGGVRSDPLSEIVRCLVLKKIRNPWEVSCGFGGVDPITKKLLKVLMCTSGGFGKCNTCFGVGCNACCGVGGFGGVDPITKKLLKVLQCSSGFGGFGGIDPITKKCLKALKFSSGMGGFNKLGGMGGLGGFGVDPITKVLRCSSGMGGFGGIDPITKKCLKALKCSSGGIGGFNKLGGMGGIDSMSGGVSPDILRLILVCKVLKKIKSPKKLMGGSPWSGYSNIGVDPITKKLLKNIQCQSTLPFASLGDMNSLPIQKLWKKKLLKKMLMKQLGGSSSLMC